MAVSKALVVDERISERLIEKNHHVPVDLVDVRVSLHCQIDDVEICRWGVIVLQDGYELGGQLGQIVLGSLSVSSELVGISVSSLVGLVDVAVEISVIKLNWCGQEISRSR